MIRITALFCFYAARTVEIEDGTDECDDIKKYQSGQNVQGQSVCNDLHSDHPLALHLDVRQADKQAYHCRF